MIKKLITKTIACTALSVIPVIAITSCATEQIKDDSKDEVDQATIANANKQIYLVNQNNQVITSDEGFKQINALNVGKRLAGIKNWEFNEKWMEISDWQSDQNQISFTITMGNLKSDLIQFWKPTASVDQLIIDRGLNDPNHNLALSTTNAIRSGKLNQVSVQDQAQAISQYVIKQWKLQAINAKDPYTYQVAFSANTNSAFNKSFAKNWSEVFAHFEPISNPWWKQLNQDWTSVNQVILGLKIKETIRDLNPNGVASFQLTIEYVQLSWKKDDPLPNWLLPNTTSYRYWLKDVNVDLKVKNVSGDAGTIVAI